jgi:Flp pilus assembly protein TadB
MAVESQYGPKERAEYDTKERVVSTQKARSGIELQSMRYVLGFGIAGVVIAFILAWYFMFRA